jgi:hypothetical protein
VSKKTSCCVPKVAVKLVQDPQVIEHYPIALPPPAAGSSHRWAGGVRFINSAGRAVCLRFVPRALCGKKPNAVELTFWPLLLQQDPNHLQVLLRLTVPGMAGTVPFVWNHFFLFF